jgi:hypothetical protein
LLHWFPPALPVGQPQPQVPLAPLLNNIGRYHDIDSIIQPPPDILDMLVRQIIVFDIFIIDRFCPLPTSYPIFIILLNLIHLPNLRKRPIPNHILNKLILPRPPLQSFVSGLLLAPYQLIEHQLRNCLIRCHLLRL